MRRRRSIRSNFCLNDLGCVLVPSLFQLFVMDRNLFGTMTSTTSSFCSVVFQGIGEHKALDNDDGTANQRLDNLLFTASLVISACMIVGVFAYLQSRRR